MESQCRGKCNKLLGLISMHGSRRMTVKFAAWMQSIAPQLFAVSLFPYLVFLYFLTKTPQVPRLSLFGFYFLLAFVGATIPAGIYGMQLFEIVSYHLTWCCFSSFSQDSLRDNACKCRLWVSHWNHNTNLNTGHVSYLTPYYLLLGLHGSAESLLTITNLLIVLGLRQGIREASEKKSKSSDNSEDQE